MAGSSRARGALESADGNEATVSCTAPAPTPPPTPGPPPTPEEQAWYDAKLARARRKREKRRRKWAHAAKMKALKWTREVQAYRKLARSDPEFAETQSIHGTEIDEAKLFRNIAASLGHDPLTLRSKRVMLDRGIGDPTTPKGDSVK